MLLILNALQLVLYIALLSLLGQALLYVLAGAKRETNVFYKLLKLMTKPFTWPMRKITPHQVADRHVPLVTFFVLALLYFIVTFEKIDHCMSTNLVGCR
jgi:uncharacterized protein YggT (Ycf19 family)